MKKPKHTSFPHLLPFFCFTLFFLTPYSNVVVAGESSAEHNPFTPKASLIRYWKKQVSNDLPKPWFFLNKASPLTPVQLATFSKLADQNSLSTQLPGFCKSANLLCFDDLSPSLESHPNNVKFSVYSEKNFTNYGNGQLGNADSFKNYNGDNVNNHSFRRYSHDSTGHSEKFSIYAIGLNVIDQRFNTYGTSATGGAGEFKVYNGKSNVPGLHFTSYSSDANGRKQAFSSYATDSNAGDEYFTNYGKNGNGVYHDFKSYGKDSNVIGSDFSNYGKTGNGATDTFTLYGFGENDHKNNFKNYGDGGNAASETFKSYSDQSNVGEGSFTSYGKNSNSAEMKFTNYGKSFNGAPQKFTGYGQNAKGHTIGFKTYGLNNTFKGYAQKGVSFSDYMNKTSGVLSASLAAESGKKVNTRWVEPGKFFREKMLKSGVVMPMPDIKDKMPYRSFLPRLISSKLPFSTSKIGELKKIFHAADDSTMNSMMVDTLSECERAPSPGENKRCVSSAEDMIDFATMVLGRNVAVGTTENTKGSKGNILIGSVKGINGGKVTKAVSCHQSLFPYLLYYCHSVPKVRVYEADLLDPESKAKINHGVAICHVDTSSWSSNHGAFLELGSGPGKIEVCHWIFENDMTWTVADS
ncbi:hypothetical protein Leryth_023628 [Lithospermum erythrorhizon]|nr:hypothetical protein Leryth_023628 [Lithospermum erythrorhizon]